MFQFRDLLLIRFNLSQGLKASTAAAAAAADAHGDASTFSCTDAETLAKLKDDEETHLRQAKAIRFTINQLEMNTSFAELSLGDLFFIQLVSFNNYLHNGSKTRPTEIF